MNRGEMFVATTFPRRGMAASHGDAREALTGGARFP